MGRSAESFEQLMAGESPLKGTKLESPMVNQGSVAPPKQPDLKRGRRYQQDRHSRKSSRRG